MLLALSLQYSYYRDARLQALNNLTCRKLVLMDIWVLPISIVSVNLIELCDYSWDTFVSSVIDAISWALLLT